MKVLLAVLGACLVLANAHPSRKRDFGVDEAMELAEDRSRLEEALKDATPKDIREASKSLRNDLLAADKDLEGLLAAGDVIDSDYNVNPKYIEMSAKYAEDFEKALEDLENLPPLPRRQDMHFLDDCIKEAEKINWNDKSTVEFVNDVTKGSLMCIRSGMAILLKESNLDDLKDDELTVDEIDARLGKAQEVLIEAGHVVKFLMGLEEELVKGEKTHNQILGLERKGFGKGKKGDDEKELLEEFMSKFGKGDKKDGKGKGKGDDDKDRDGTKPPRPEGTKPPRPEGTKPPRPDDERELLKELLREFGKGKAGKGKGKGEKPKPKGTKPPRPEGTKPPRPEGTRPPKPDGTKPPRPDKEDAEGFLKMLESKLEAMKRMLH